MKRALAWIVARVLVLLGAIEIAQGLKELGHMVAENYQPGEFLTEEADEVFTGAIFLLFGVGLLLGGLILARRGGTLPQDANSVYRRADLRNPWMALILALVAAPYGTYQTVSGTGILIALGRQPFLQGLGGSQDVHYAFEGAKRLLLGLVALLAVVWLLRPWWPSKPARARTSAERSPTGR